MLFIITICLLSLLVFGFLEHRKHNRNVEAIPVRININGVRGKSTVTRLVTGVLTEANYQTVGKTTGTQARMLYWYKDQEDPIVRRPEGPNIGEQKGVMKKVAEEDADALVSECMAVTPDYQTVFQEKMLKANIGVIVNVLEDHMDLLGPTLDEVAYAFTATIPHNGHLIVNESPYVPMYKEIAEERNTKVIVCDTSRIPEAFLLQFDYMVFPENAALALAVADALGIDQETAFKGMLNAWPDPGSLQITPLDLNQKQPSFLVNGFAANDATSTINIWERVQTLGYPTNDAVVVMNCRSDRYERTEQFAHDVLPYLPCRTLVIIGETTAPIVDNYNNGNIPTEHLLNLEGYSTEEILEEIKPYIQETVIYGVGNIHGAAEPLTHELKKMQMPIEEKVAAIN
ncbi:MULTISPECIES: poly-gamma-glutamate synthase PgsB [Geomicrobium]|uniref:Poly-gamma-glutamate synthase PgsB/CapB n=1 Tax=Geomicrobium sediminis TaxID=1347788 RepID=A0ABS2PG37_9BACL|nr:MULTISPECIES: poly-gamma-glutamate synthase PgsB [Geomicrobium]MBM7634399.1 poly-gamma-glutamate synthase PgsB/CapB [Geomicrobium sediminis]GAK09809.1 poly-gamma-glutamate synthase subunit PgsB/CapB [Geomicrobium sp. JCM 19038]